ncbi:MAG: PAS domain S-box protein [Halodesulfurarchaeum sp.]
MGLASIFVWEVFPRAYVEGQGLTQFKIVSEFVIMGLLIAAEITLYGQRDAFDQRVFVSLSVAILLTIGAELAFTMYISVYGFSNAVGHFLKLGSVFLVYRAVVKTGIRDPQRTLYRTLAARERDLRQYRQAVESANDLLAAVDTDCNYLFANEAYCQYHGVESEAIQGKSLPSVVGPEEYRAVKGPIRAALQGERTRLEITRSTPGKGDRIFDVQLFPIFDEGDDVHGVGASMRDITDQKEAERRLEALFDNLPGIVYRRPNERGWPMELVGGQCHEITGYAADSIERGDVSWGEDVVHPADREAAWTAVQRAVSGDGSFELTYRIHTRSGEEKWVRERGQETVPVDSNESVLEGLITDVTERKRLEGDHRDAKERYESLFTSIQDAILVADTDRRIINCNPAFTDLFGYELDEIRGKPTKTYTRATTNSRRWARRYGARPHSSR